MFLARQGDVLIFAASSIPAHAILDRDAELLAAPGTEDRFLRIMATSGVET